MTDAIIEAMGDSIKNEFGDEYEVYSEPMPQGTEEPCFFILLLNSSMKRVMDKRYFRTHQFCIQYLPADELNPKTEFNDVSERLMLILDDITVNGNVIHGKDIHVEIADGVLNFIVNYDMFVYRYQKPADKMETITITQTLKRGEQS